MEDENRIYVKDVLGTNLEDNFLDFDITEVQLVLTELQNQDAIDLPHAEMLAQKCLRCADLLSELLGKLTKTLSNYESRINSAKNQASLDYEFPGGKTTAEMRKWAGEVDPTVKSLQEQLAYAKGSKVFLEKKFDIIIKSHHHYKDLSSGLRKTILGYREGY